MVPRGASNLLLPFFFINAYIWIYPFTGNMYYIQNISDRDAKLFFAQARKVEVDDEDTARSTTGGRVSQSQSRSPSRKPSKAPNGKTGRAASRVV